MSSPRMSGYESVAIIVRIMDRAAELQQSLPSLLNQDYPNYSVTIVDHSSQDGLDGVLASMPSPRLRVVRCPRPRYFNRSRAGNTGVRYSSSDLLFFLDSNVAFRDRQHLSSIIADFEGDGEIDFSHFARWRLESAYPPLDRTALALGEPGRRVYSECECHGLHLLVRRNIFQRIGGLNEALFDWGYEDTDLAMRLELCGYGRVPIRGLVEQNHGDDLRVRFHREKSKERSWTKNRRISDGLVATVGPILKTQRTPGLCDWVEIDGVFSQGTEAPQQDWTMQTVAQSLPATVRGSDAALTRAHDQMPLVSVVVPTKNAAEYLVVVLDSILSQDYPNIECVVVDGGSTDATLEILAAYGDRISWSSQPDRGAFDAINRGWQNSGGEILAWLNADDSWAPGGVVEAVQAFCEDPEVAIVYGDCLIVDADGRELERRRPPVWDLGYAVENCHHMIDQPAAFIRRTAAQRVGWLYPAWFHDWDLWRRVSLAGGKIKRIPHLLGCARVRVDNTQYRPDVLVEGLVGLTKRFFSFTGLPEDLQALRRRSMSNCYLKAVQTLQYGRPESRWLHHMLRVRALVADPTNLLNVLNTRPTGRRHPLPVSALPENALYTEGLLADRGSSVGTSAIASPPPQIDHARAGAGPRELRESDDGKERRLVSVVVPCKNDERYLSSALDSILGQDYPNIECIVVDGGSTDGTIELLKRYGAKISWLSEPDRGAFDAINRGWKLSKGEILAWLNADDLWEPGAVTAAVEVFESQPDVDVVYGTAGVVDEVGRVLGDLVPRPWNLEDALRHCDHIIFQPASFMQRRILERVGWLYPAWCHDHDLWLRIARVGGKFAQIPTRLAMDRMRAENLGRVAKLVIPAKIGLTKRFFAEPGLPPGIRDLRGRALSSAYARAVDYLSIGKPHHWLVALRLLAQAIAADPGNLREIGERFTRPFRWYASRFVIDLSGFARSVTTPIRSRVISGLVLRRRWWPWRELKQSFGRMVERVLVRGNRELIIHMRSLDRRFAALEQSVSELVQSAGRVDRSAEDVPRFAEGIGRELTTRLDRIDSDLPRIGERLERELSLGIEALNRRIDTVHRALSDTMSPIEADVDRMAQVMSRLAGDVSSDRAATIAALESLTVQHEKLQEELRAMQERPLLKLSEAGGLRVYGAPPTLRRIAGWHTCWGLDGATADPFIEGRLAIWSSLENPVVMSWFADLLVMIWPNNELSRVLFLTGNFEPNEATWMSQALTKGMTMIDVGAHMGMYSLMASRLVGESGTVLALEPSLREFQRLGLHVTLNHLQNVRCIHAAASDAAGEGTLRIAWEWNSGHNTFGDFFSPSVELAGEELVRTQTIDALVAANGLQRVDLIKVDVEGHELKALVGAVDTLRRFRPLILIEVFEETLRRQGVSVESVLAFFECQGYTMKEFSLENGELVAFSGSVGSESRNLVAVPS